MSQNTEDGVLLRGVYNSPWLKVHVIKLIKEKYDQGHGTCIPKLNVRKNILVSVHLVSYG